MLSPDPNPVPLDPLLTETPAAAVSADTATPLPESEAEPPVEESVTDADPVDVPVENGATGDEQDGGASTDSEQFQETWPVFVAGTATSVTSGPLNLHVEPALWARY